VFRGDAARWNPAELLIAALSTCHQLWYLHVCADTGIVVVAYSDDASGVEIEQADGLRRRRGAIPAPLAYAVSAEAGNPR
jgi:organic hydroperoxide reductase OsmC/OhrA